MVITDLRMEKETSGFDVIRFAKKQAYNPATAILTAFPTLGNNWQQEGANQLLVKPVGTDELIRQLESMLITHEDSKHKKNQTGARCRGPSRARRPSATVRSARSADHFQAGEDKPRLRPG